MPMRFGRPLDRTDTSYWAAIHTNRMSLQVCIRFHPVHFLGEHTRGALRANRSSSIVLKPKAHEIARGDGGAGLSYYERKDRRLAVAHPVVPWPVVFQG